MKFKLIKQFKNGKVTEWRFSKEFANWRVATCYVQKRFKVSFLCGCILVDTSTEKTVKYF